nr:O-methyltransferase [Pseudooceanicola nitratireducens]
MVDHISMYKRNGISKLYSFDADASVVQRQVFNAPTSTTKCEQMLAENLADRLGEIQELLDVDSFVIWLDYTGNSNRGAQITEFQVLLENLNPGDIARISLDASMPSEKLKANLPQDIKNDHVAAMTELLKREIGELHPEAIQLGSERDIPTYFSTCLMRACDRAVQNRPNNPIQFIPILETCYTDTCPMYTCTILAQDINGQPSVPVGFHFLSEEWGRIEALEVPELTAREKSFLDRLLDKAEGEFNENLGYSIAREAQALRQWASFKKFHRFLPQFLHVDIK